MVFSSYRAVSVLPVSSKLLETCVKPFNFVYINDNELEH